MFNIASITKSVTAIGVLKLAQEGKLNLSDKIDKFFTGIPQDKKDITVSQLLTHTTGLQQNYVCMGVTSRDTAVMKLLNDTLAFIPGTDFTYSNENYEMLAAILEIVTGKTYEEYIRNDILVPSGMNDSYFWNEVSAKSDKVAAVTDLALSEKRDWDFLGSGGIFSNTNDLYKLYLAVKNNKILNEEFTSKMFANNYVLKSGLVIGFGWFVNDPDNVKRENWTRGTESFGHNAVIRWFPEKKITVIVTTNSGEIYGPSGTANRTISEAIINELMK